MLNSVEEYNLDIFLKGENTDLCTPTEEFAKSSSWYKWFNDPVITRFLEQGIFPNTSQSQVEFFNNTRKNQDRISFIISDKSHYIGTISLSNINLTKKTAEAALLFGEKSNHKYADLIALEAMALITEFGIERIGLKRISAGQHEKLVKWQRRLELIGYRLEGYKIGGFIKGREFSNSVLIAITENDYFKIKSKRGNLWAGSEKMIEKLNAMPAEPFVNTLKSLMQNEGNKYYETIFDL